MTTLIGLFKNEQDAETAVQSLAAANLDGIEFRMITDWEQDREPEVPVVMVPSFGVNPNGISVAPIIPDPVEASSEETRFFKRTVQDGGVMLIVEEVDDEQVPQVKNILQEAGEKVTTGA